MLQKINYQKELDRLITDLQKEEKVPTLLLHSCCAPCSSYVLEYLSNYFITTRTFTRRVNTASASSNSRH